MSGNLIAFVKLTVDLLPDPEVEWRFSKIERQFDVYPVNYFGLVCVVGKATLSFGGRKDSETHIARPRELILL